eukprot:CAMPEP_0172538512 /NCGR_PEP_ID=MMETSP1067-20121228/9887_1 /TAXON_ID=265564 ORGANISM="Thalassiosira punctigera, Strain Tpunct2005C2" /NCGR_SAMPLE_ID=MMETSP1067 /ASSEMBLY_ACC=CAM_ASM_000444 /LENGTH=272 /DNA_ID=CAMNT_0013324019 /DNA_START=77 /DNA_END=891 /DNA_ORIENTATION=-
MGFKDLLKQSNNNASTALSDLIAHEDWQLVLMEVKMWPDAAKKWTNRVGFFDGEHDSRVLPIHMACALQCPPDVVDTLVECYPLGVRTREDAFQRLPLHVACQTNASIGTIEALIRHYPEATRAKDSIGRLPIHYACSHNLPSSVIDLLLREFPASAGCGDDNGWMPIHVACRRGVSLYVIERLLDCLPQSADMATNKGSTPIICAQKGSHSQRHEDIIQFLEDYIQRQSSMEKKELVPTEIRTEKKSPVKTGTLLPMGFPATATLHHRHVG